MRSRKFGAWRASISWRFGRRLIGQSKVNCDHLHHLSFGLFPANTIICTAQHTPSPAEYAVKLAQSKQPVSLIIVIMAGKVPSIACIGIIGKHVSASQAHYIFK
jgi:hypothetical protein